MLGSLSLFFFNFPNLFEVIVMMTAKHESRIMIIFKKIKNTAKYKLKN